MSERRKWKVTINAWELMEIKDIEAESEEEAQEVALEWVRDDFNVDRLDGGVNSIQAEQESL
jgi:hypothetical protein